MTETLEKHQGYEYGSSSRSMYGQTVTSIIIFKIIKAHKSHRGTMSSN